MALLSKLLAWTLRGSGAHKLREAFACLFVMELLSNTYSEKYGNQCMDESLFSLSQILPDFLLAHLLETGSRVK